MSFVFSARSVFNSRNDDSRYITWRLMRHTGDQKASRGPHPYAQLNISLRPIATVCYGVSVPVLQKRLNTTGVNSLPKTVTRQRRDCDLNPGRSAPESSTLTTRLPSHPVHQYTQHFWEACLTPGTPSANPGDVTAAKHVPRIHRAAGT